jgi:hypothetical protein
MARHGKRRARPTLPVLPSLLPDGPPEIQLRTGKAMRSEWRDPTDLDPARRVARTIRGFRGRCPLRYYINRFGERSGYTPEMVEAADRLRWLFDGARLGFRGLLDWRPVSAIRYGPMSGPSRTALKQLKCREMFEHTWALFDETTRLLLMMVVLLRQAFSGPIGAYPNIGYHRAGNALEQGRQWHDLDTTSYTPADLARDGATWLSMGAQIVGGCCGTTPEHIAALRRVVPQAEAPVE